MGLSIRTKLMGTMAFSVIATIFVGWLGTAGMGDIKTTLNALYADDFVPARVIAEANIAIMAWNRDVLNYLLARESQRQEAYKQEAALQEKALQARLDDLSKMEALTEEEKYFLARIGDHVMQAESLWSLVSAQSRSWEQAKNLEVGLEEFESLIGLISKEMHDFLELQEAQSVAAKAAADKRFRKDLNTITVIVGLTAIALLSVNLLMAGGFIRSIEALDRGVKELGRGNFNHRVAIKVRDELSRLAAVFNSMAGEVKRSRDALQKAHDELEVRVVERTSELATINEELQKEVAERKRVEEALRESSEKLKFFSYSVVHDLKSPAVGVCGIANLLHRHYMELLDERGRTYCDQILRASKHIATFVDRINTYIASKEDPLAIEELKIKEILEMVREEFDHDLCSRRIVWHPPHPDSLEIRADSLSMVRVFRNLVGNAVKYGGEDLTEISIGYEQTADFHIFSVSDDGVGIKKEDSEKVFEMFQRNSKSSQTEGAGLGLTIVKEIAERHGGRVWVTPREPRGTVFHVAVSTAL